MKRTDRGFAVYAEFKDYYGQGVRVQASSLADKRCVWIFPEHHKHRVTGEHICGAHLTEAMAKKVIRALQAFVDGKE
jgi:hypothetical protein